MTRNPKVLCTALVAALALSAATASTASAWFDVEGELTNPTLTASAVTSQVFNFGTKKLTCTGIALDNADVPTAYITATPTYSGCTLTEGGSTLTAHVEFTNCDYEFHTDRTLHIDCLPGGEIHVKVTVLGMKMNCFTIQEQTPTAPKVDYINAGAGTTRDVRIIPTVEGIQYTKLGFCGEGIANNGTYTGEITVKADNAEGKHVGIWWTEH
jgi:hypothetical protein